MKERIIIILLFFSICFVFFTFWNTIYAQQQDQSQGSNGIILSDPKLKLELVTSGLDFPTTMAFLSPNDFLILEKSGTVKRVTDGQIVGKPLLHVDVNEKDERGLLGIAVSNKREKSNDTSISKQEVSLKVFLYYITCEGKMLIVRIKYIDMI